MRVDQALRQTEGIESDTPRLDLELLLLHVLKRERSFLHTWPEYELSAEEQVAFDSLLEQRRQGRPVAHLLGYRGFWSFDLEVNEHTLIPRPDTEILVETALNKLDQRPISALDLGTGTGAIALALALERPQWRVSASDRVGEAVALAQRNAQRLEITNIEVKQGRWFEPFDGRFDLIVSNPPYIDPQDHHLSTGDLRFEPLSALVADNQGLADLEHLITEARRFLNPGGWLMLEHGYDQADWVAAQLKQCGYQQIDQVRDLGGHLRVSLGRWMGESDANG